jgi:mannan endo-1,4-beta-mannosidase
LLQRWLTEVAGAIAEADPTHLLTVGEEGFWSSAWRGSSFTGFDANPEPWAAHTGQDFSTQHALATITYASTHLWPSNWAVVGGLGLLFPNSFSRNWIAAHIAASAALNKPLLLSEFGHYRDDSSASLLTRGSGNALQFMDSVWSAMEESVTAGRAGQGSALWSVYPECLRSASSADPYAIFTTDAEMMGRFRKHIARMQTGAGKKVAGC